MEFFIVELRNEYGSGYGYEAYPLPKNISIEMYEFLKTHSCSWHFEQNTREWSLWFRPNGHGSIMNHEEVTEWEETHSGDIWKQFHIRPMGFPIEDVETAML